jgi:hypothetical protein
VAQTNDSGVVQAINKKVDDGMIQDDFGQVHGRDSFERGVGTGDMVRMEGHDGTTVQSNDVVAKDEEDVIQENDGGKPVRKLTRVPSMAVLMESPLHGDLE